MAAPESAIRDNLAADLSILEPGLRLIEVEHHLSNARGTRGYIDILARDRYGNFVVIEVKRSNNSAARGLHELHKYAALLTRERGLGPERVRCVLVSTDWDELRVPFDHHVANSTHDTIGLQLVVDEKGAIKACSQVDRLPPESVGSVTEVQCLLEYASEQERQDAWEDLSAALTDGGCPNHLGFLLTAANPTFDVESYAIYLLLGRISTANVDHEFDPGDDDLALDAPTEFVREHLLLERTVRDHHGHATAISVGHPDKLEHLVNQSEYWSLDGVLRSGLFAAQTCLLSDEDLVTESTWSTGLSHTSFGALASPLRSEHWNATRSRMDAALVSNPDWFDLVNAWLDEAVQEHPSADFAIAIYNPGDMVGSIVNSATDPSAESMPLFEVQVLNDEHAVRLISGCVVWDASVPQPSLAAAFENTYGDTLGWAIARNLGETSVFDADLGAESGLVYACFEFLPGDGPVFRLELRDESLVRVAGDPTASEMSGVRPISAWIEENRVQLHDLIEDFSKTSRGIFLGLDRYGIPELS